METATKKKSKVVTQSNMYIRTIEKLLSSLKKGRINITYPDHSTYTFGEGGDIHASIKINSYNFFRRCFYYGDIGFGEAFMEGEWESENITNVIRWMILNIEDLEGASGGKKSSFKFNIFKFTNIIGNFLNRNTKEQAQKNIHYHYDLSNEFFKLMLDKSMTYSSGYFKEATDSLYQSQLNKYELLANKLHIQKEDHVLEVGSGWGGNAIYLAQTYGCRVHSVTISKEQLKYAKENAIIQGVDDLVTFEYKDFRDLEGKYDKIVSIEMIEALGESYLDTYFTKLSSLLKHDGLLGIQAITSPDSRYIQFKNGVDWIQKHIFPGSLLPSVGRMHEATLKHTDLHLVSLIDIGSHYAKTLHVWRDNFFENIEEVKKLGFDNVFINKWNYYLSYCEAAFMMKNISDVQVVFARPNNTKIKGY